ncbi:MAG: hypothetical protein HY700_16330 [Gemmatimonadetes bacterium]|nr:hypothetical protein [Gemmatimonadota bacterium]
MRTWLLSLTLLVAQTTCRGQGAPLAPDPHHHVVPVHEPQWKADLAPNAHVVPVQGLVAGSDSVVSPAGRWRAFVVPSQEEPGGRVCFQEVGGGRVYELRGIPLPYRPLSDLVWLDEDRLAFDRWSQPHYGIHYVLDVRRRRLVLAAPFPDAFFLHHRVPEGDTGAKYRP